MDWMCIGCARKIHQSEWETSRSDKTKVASYCDCYFRRFQCPVCLHNPKVEYDYGMYRGKTPRESHDFHDNIPYNELPDHLQSH
jgi:hypothetical protein